MAAPVSSPARGGAAAVCVSVALALALPTSGAGCATATRLHTRPEGATVYVDGELIGKTPVVYDNDPGLPRRYHVQLYKPGYAPLDFYLDAKMSWLWGYVGAVTLVPYLWAWSLGREYVFALTPAGELPDGSDAAPPARSEAAPPPGGDAGPPIGGDTAPPARGEAAPPAGGQPTPPAGAGANSGGGPGAPR